MKVSVHDIARAYIDLAAQAPESEHEEIAQAAIELLQKHGLMRFARTFPALVAKLWRKRDGAISLEITTPFPDAAEAECIRSVVEKALSRPSMLLQAFDKLLIGGAVVRVEDERFDYSVRSALSELANSVSDTLPLPS